MYFPITRVLGTELIAISQISDYPTGVVDGVKNPITMENGATGTMIQSGTSAQISFSPEIVITSGVCMEVTVMPAPVTCPALPPAVVQDTTLTYEYDQKRVAPCTGVTFSPNPVGGT